MKAIEELIPKLNNSQEFQPLIDTFIESIQKHVSEIHSIYMCGSIPKGTAIPYESDADFTVVLKINPTDFDKESIRNLTVETHKKFNIVTKIDVPICTVQDVLSNPYDWGFGSRLYQFVFLVQIFQTKFQICIRLLSYKKHISKQQKSKYPEA